VPILRALRGDSGYSRAFSPSLFSSKVSDSKVIFFILVFTPPGAPISRVAFFSLFLQAGARFEVGIV